LDSVVEYPNIESVSEKLRRLLPDTVVIINKINAYHLEAEIRDNEDIVLRAFEYGFAEALRTKTVSDDGQVISVKFPDARIIYWETTERTPDEVTLSIKFPGDFKYDYVVKTFKILDYGIKELEEKKLAILLPFCVLKLRKRVVSAKSSKRRAELSAEMKTILDELVAAIKRAEKNGLMSEEDSRIVLEYTERLYKALYQQYEEFKEADVTLRDIILTYSEEAELRGIEKGVEKGIEKGIEKKALEVARKMLARGAALADIADIAGLPIDKIQALVQR
jgi:hypothetical protein